MAESKKFGTFGGVFTPSILTILGVIMYLRMGWVVGNGGLYLTIGIILLAHLISIATGLSISSIATDKKVGAGGVYYVLSRSLGLPIGGALGMTLFVATALSIALYMVGFAEIFNEYINFGYEINTNGEKVVKEGVNLINTYRITGSLGLLALTIIAFISTSIAIKSQYIILTAIVLSLFSIFLGSGAETVTVASEAANSGVLEKAGFAAIFAIFFPAVTGFTAGVAMSGDLKDPKRGIPVGTMGAIAVGLVVYLALAVFLYYAIDEQTLLYDKKAIFNYAAVGILVYAGVWGATLSSALGGILGGPRILQAMSVDKLAPKIFAKGVGSSNEPRNALILTVVIAEGGILIGDLDVIAEVVSMFYLAAYGFINLSFFLESWASSDFNPTFKVKKWVGLLGFIATVIIMSQLNLLAMVVAYVIIGGIYIFYSRRQIALGTGDIWQSVWATIVKKGLKRMEAGNDHKRNWKPNTLLFSTDNEQRSKMIEFSKAVSGQAGIITNFDLHENPEAPVLFPKSKEQVQDEELEKYGIFGRKLEVQNIFKGIESIACTFGFSGIEPNTVLMNWPGQTKDPHWFKQMTEKLIALDYNVLYLDYDERWGFRKKEKIDLWWRGVGNNAELMLSLAKFITASPDWSQANIRILLVNNTNVDFKIVENRIRSVVDQFRVKAEVKVINNEVDGRNIYDLMKMHSSEADLVFVGIPEVDSDEKEEFVERTNNLVSVIGTTLLVKASSKFDETDLQLEQISLNHEPRKLEQTEIIELEPCADLSFYGGIHDFDTRLDALVTQLIQEGIQPVEDYHHTIFAKVTNRMDGFLSAMNETDTRQDIQDKLQTVLNEIKAYFKDALENQLPMVYDELDREIGIYFEEKEALINYLPKKLPVEKMYDGEVLVSNSRKVEFKNAVLRIWLAKGLKQANSSLVEFGYQNLILLHQSKNILHDIVWKLLGKVDANGIQQSAINDCKTELDNALQLIDEEAMDLAANLYTALRNNERTNLNQLSQLVLHKKFNQQLQLRFEGVGSKEFQQFRKDNKAFPSYWYRNLILFTYHLQADIYLIAYTSKVQALSLELNDYANENYIKKINDNVGNLTAQVAKLKGFVENDQQKEILATAIRVEEELFFNTEYAITTLLSAINELNQTIPDEIELMTARSINGIREQQGGEVLTEKIALKDITEYISRTYFVDPLHERIQVFYDQLKRLTGKLINATLLVQKGIDNYATSGKINILTDTVSQVEADIADCKNDLLSAEAGFLDELKNRQNLLRTELDINQIIEQVETLRQYVKQQKRRNVLLDKFHKVNKEATKKVGSFFNYLAQKQQDISSQEYQSKYRHILSEQALLSEFVEEVDGGAELPFYYQQLFRGTHYSDSKTIENRKGEVAKIKGAIQRINGGSAGSILILGNASSGKTFLATHVASHELEGSIYKVAPPLNRIWNKEDLSKAIQRSTGFNESITRVFNKLPAKSSIILEDIEQWWLKAADGGQVINELVKIINKFGNKHYFILTANIHSYALLQQATNVQEAIIQSVILSPLNANQIKDVLWTRHQTGGLRINIDNEPEQHLSVNKLNKFLTKFHTSSKGNVGLALQQWTNAVYEKKETELKMQAPTIYELNGVMAEEWKNLLYQLYIHYNLSREELYRIYGDDSKNWVNRLLQALRNAGVLEQNERGEFIIKKSIKPYIEIWLNELGFIK